MKPIGKIQLGNLELLFFTEASATLTLFPVRYESPRPDETRLETIRHQTSSNILSPAASAVNLMESKPPVQPRTHSLSSLHETIRHSTQCNFAHQAFSVAPRTLAAYSRLMTTTPKDVWNPQQYDKFKKQRAEPFYDLMSLLETSQAPDVVDLGCGTGELTSELHHFVKAKRTLGMDTSAQMLKKANAFANSDLTFMNGDISEFSKPGQFDIIFSNAAIQWCSHHEDVFKRLKDSLKPKGQMAIQMPMNHEYATHVLADEMAREPKWAAALNGQHRITSLLTVEQYASLLFRLGFEEQKVQLRVYGHVLDSREGVIEWVKGTLLTYFQERLNPASYQEFLSEFRERLFQILPDEKPFFYPFKRILIWARTQ